MPTLRDILAKVLRKSAAPAGRPRPVRLGLEAFEQRLQPAAPLPSAAVPAVVLPLPKVVDTSADLTALKPGQNTVRGVHLGIPNPTDLAGYVAGLKALGVNTVRWGVAVGKPANGPAARPLAGQLAGLDKFLAEARRQGANLRVVVTVTDAELVKSAEKTPKTIYQS